MLDRFSLCVCGGGGSYTGDISIFYLEFYGKLIESAQG